MVCLRKPLQLPFFLLSLRLPLWLPRAVPENNQNFLKSAVFDLIIFLENNIRNKE